jgi:uroporphyrinogen decarboxylase
MIESQVDAISLDSPEAGVILPEVAKNMKTNTIIIGNINPAGTILTGSPQQVKEEVNELLHSMDFYPNFVLSTGCDLPQEVPFENIEAFMETGRQYRIRKSKK